MKDFIIGPTITISSPTNGESVGNSLIELKGTAKNISYISVNDRRIFTDEEGVFKEKLLLYPGYNIISVKAEDRFDRNIEKTLELVYKEPGKNQKEREIIIYDTESLTNKQSTSTEEDLSKLLN